MSEKDKENIGKFVVWLFLAPTFYAWAAMYAVRYAFHAPLPYHWALAFGLLLGEDTVNVVIVIFLLTAAGVIR